MYLLKTIKRNNYVKSINENSIFASSSSYKALVFNTKEEAELLISKFNFKNKVVIEKCN